MHEIVDDIATEKAINSIGNRNNNETEYRPKSPKREETFNTDFTTLDSPFDIGRYKAKSPKFEEKSNNDFETSSDTFFARPQTSFKRSGLINDIDTPFNDPMNGLWIHNQTQVFDAEVPDTIVKSLEKHKSQKTNTILFENSSSPITTGNAVFEETFDAEYKPKLPNSIKSNNDFETLDSPLDFGIYNPKLPKSEEKFNGFKTSSDNFFATPQTSFKSNKPNIFLYEDDEDYGRPQEDFAMLPKIRKYGKSEAQQAKEARILDFLPEHVEAQRGMVERGSFTHTNTRPDKEWITPEKKK